MCGGLTQAGLTWKVAPELLPLGLVHFSQAEASDILSLLGSEL